MSIVKAKPTSPGRRIVVTVKHDDIYKGKGYKPLLEKKASLVVGTIVAESLLDT